MPAMMAERTGSRFDSGLLKLWMVRGPSQLCAKVWFRQVLSSTCNWIEMEVHSGQQLFPAQETNEIIPCGQKYICRSNCPYTSYEKPKLVVET